MKRTVCNIDHSVEGAPQYHYIYTSTYNEGDVQETPKLLYMTHPATHSKGVHSQVLEDGVRIGQPLKHEVAIQGPTNENNAHVTLLIAQEPCNSGAVRPITKHGQSLGLFRSHGTNIVIRSTSGDES